MKETFLFYKDWHNVIRELPSDIRLDVYDAVMEYALFGKQNDLKPMAKIAFSFIKQTIDRDAEKYMSISKLRSEAGKKGSDKKWQTIANDSKNSKCHLNDNDNDNDNDNVNDNDLLKKEIEFQNFGKVVKTNEDFIEKALSDEEDEFRNLCKKAGLVGNFETTIKDFYQKQKVLGKNWSNFSEFKRHFHNSVPYLKSNKPSNNAEITEEKVRSLGYKSVEQFRKVNSS